MLGANDGIVSTASLVLGVAAANGTHGAILVAGRGRSGRPARCRWPPANTCRSIRRPTPRPPTSRKERAELAADGDAEHRELAAIYVGRGLTPSLATEVAVQLMAHDAIGAHSRDELGISEALSARPVQAALASAASFSVGAALPLLVAALAPPGALIAAVCVTSLVFLAILGGVSARTGGAPPLVAAWRVTFWGALAMAVTAGAGRLFGAAV